MSDSLRLHGLQPTRLLCPWDFPSKSTKNSSQILPGWDVQFLKGTSPLSLPLPGKAIKLCFSINTSPKILSPRFECTGAQRQCFQQDKENVISRVLHPIPMGESPSPPSNSLTSARGPTVQLQTLSTQRQHQTPQSIPQDPLLYTSFRWQSPVWVVTCASTGPGTNWTFQAHPL